MRKPLIFFLILGSMASGILLVTADFGESSTSLGQFTDEYTDLNYTSVRVEVVRNATYNAMELNYTSDGNYENYTTYTKTGPDARLTVNDFNISTNPDFRRGTDEGYYIDQGAGNIGAFSYSFEAVISDVEAGDTDSRDMGSIFTVNNWIGDQQAQPVGTYDYLSVNIRNNGATDNQYTWRLVGGQNGAVVTSVISGAQAVSPNIVYGTVWRDSGGDVNLTIYSDPARTTQVISLEDNDGGQTDAFRYQYGWFAINAAGDANDWFVGSVANLVNGTAAGYSFEGYFTTTDYLDEVNGSTLVQLTNTTIPASTGITVQFSDDGSTWVDNEGNAGSNEVPDGFYAFDLRDLNWSSTYDLRYNFSSSDPTETPRLYQSRLITTEGGEVTGNGAVTIIESDFPWIAIAIILMCVAYLLLR